MGIGQETALDTLLQIKEDLANESYINQVGLKQKIFSHLSTENLQINLKQTKEVALVY